MSGKNGQPLWFEFRDCWKQTAYGQTSSWWWIPFSYFSSCIYLIYFIAVKVVWSDSRFIFKMKNFQPKIFADLSFGYKLICKFLRRYGHIGMLTMILNLFWRFPVGLDSLLWCYSIPPIFRFLFHPLTIVILCEMSFGTVNYRTLLSLALYASRFLNNFNYNREENLIYFLSSVWSAYIFGIEFKSLHVDCLLWLVPLRLVL